MIDILDIEKLDEKAKSAHQTPEVKEKASHELADIMIYLIRIADLMNINLSEATHNKIKLNNQKYPAKLVKGSAKKYNQY